ncbi:MAG: MATE family efflux transporter [Rhizobiaceae bacterium]
MNTTQKALPELKSWREHISAVLKLGLPLVGAQLSQVIIGTTDTVMIGWLGARELAAGTLGAHSFFFVLMLGAGFSIAAMTMIAQSAGSDDERGVRRSARMSLWVATGYSIIMMIPLWNLDKILVLLGQEADISKMAGGYMAIVQWSLFPALYVMSLRSFLSALEHTRIVLVAVLIAALANGLLNYALIFGNWGAPRLELEGAAIASLLGSLISLAIMFGYCLMVRDVGKYEIHVRIWRADWPAFRELLSLGWPVSLTLIAEVGLFTASSVMMGWLGAIALAAHGIALQVASAVFMIPLGFSMAATILVGRARGRNDPANLNRAALASFLVVISVALTSAIILISVPGFLVGLFLEETNPDGADVLAYAVPLLIVAATFQLVDSVQAVASGLLRGIKDMRMSMVIAVFAYWVAGMPLAYIFAFRLGLDGVGIWIGLAVGLAFAAILMTIRFFALTRRVHMVAR